MDSLLFINKKISPGAGRDSVNYSTDETSLGLSAPWLQGQDVAPSSFWKGCQGFKGHGPSAFLDKLLKERTAANIQFITLCADSFAEYVFLKS
jgi:hypothetical protein